VKQALEDLLTETLEDLGISDITPVVEKPADEKFGDYTSTIAMVLAKRLQQKPIDIATELKKRLEEKKSPFSRKEPYLKKSQKGQTISQKNTEKSVLQAIEKIDIAPPGFLNFFISASTLIRQLDQALKEKEHYGERPSSPDTGKQKKSIMVEFAHPNTHKMFHIGHLRNIMTGEVIVRLLESQGNNVIRVNYQGDVGLHIAKCLYGILENSNYKIQMTNLNTQTEKMEFLGKAYTAGSKAYEENNDAKKAIEEINSKIYAKNSEVMEIYTKTRQWSLDYFENIYKRVGTRFDRYYFEGEVYESGKKAVTEGLKKGIFEKSDGAVIFPGEQYGLHNRVFITREGNTTYEGKDMGLAKLQMAEYHPDRIIHVVASEQTAYFQVIFKAMELLFPETKGKEYHLVYGWVRLREGKMSSRTGNVVLGEWLLDTAKQEIRNILKQSDSNYKEAEHPYVSRQARDYGSAQQEEIAEKAAIAAVKYAFLKVGTNQEIAFDFASSVSFDGDSGPYLQYTYARAKSVLRKSNIQNPCLPAGRQNPKSKINMNSTLNPEERSVMRLINYFPETVADAADNYAPNTLCTYLFRLAQAFNLLYQKHQIIGNDLRINLTAAIAQVLKNGLSLLGIETLEKM